MVLLFDREEGSMNVLFSVLVAFFFVSAGWAQGGYSDDVFMFYSAPDQLSEGEMQDQILLNESFPEELETLFRLQPESKAVDWTRFGGTSEHRPFTCAF